MLRQRREDAAQASSQRVARVAALEERHRSATAVLARIDSLFAEMSERLHALGSQIEAAAAEKLQREAENLQLERQAADFTAERNAGQAREGLLQFEKDQLRARLSEIDELLRSARQLLDQARDRRGELQAAAAKLQADAMYMAETCLNELGIERPALLADTTLALVTGDELTARDQSYREMRAKLEAMGPVNMMALEEYRETAERHTFLDAQRKDLISSIENTTATIREIDEVSRQKFQEAFTRINENFQATFKKLFGGGHAFMKLTDEENSAESGIDVVASPPGKRLQSVLLLSGGEKALTALALLVGIFQYTPSPFCILDEVDAPLDEANIGRFTDLVKGDEHQNAVRPHHAQQEDDEHRARALRRNHAGAGRIEAGLSAVRSRLKAAGVRTGSSANPRGACIRLIYNVYRRSDHGGICRSHPASRFKVEKPAGSIVQSNPAKPLFRRRRGHS